MMIKVKPAPGLKVRDPMTMKFIPEEGFVLKKGITTYWARRIQCRDVSVIDPEVTSDLTVSNLNEAGGADK